MESFNSELVGCLFVFCYFGNNMYSVTHYRHYIIYVYIWIYIYIIIYIVLECSLHICTFKNI